MSQTSEPSADAAVTEGLDFFSLVCNGNQNTIIFIIAIKPL